MEVKTYKNLLVWQRAMELVKEVYTLTAAFPKDETYGLRSQMERAAVSIPSSIAEGYLRRHKKEYVYFLSVALGSSAELETQILICQTLDKFKMIHFTRAQGLTTEVMKMLYTLMKKLEDR